MFDKRIFNVLLLGLGFMFVFTAFQTFGNIQKTILDSIHKDDQTYTGDAFISLGIIYAVLAVGNWVAPSVIAAIGPRPSMILGAITYLIFIASFLSPKTWLLYFVSVIIGIGASVIWTGQGNYLTLNSDESTIGRNSGIFWALLQCSMLIGNFFVYMVFQGKSQIDEKTRWLVSCVLSVICAVGVVILCLLRAAVSADGRVVNTRSVGPGKAFIEAVKLFARKEMLLLIITFIYTGLELSFFSGVYSPSIGSTLVISEKPKELIGLSGIFIGVGEISGGVLFGLLGSKTVRWGRSPIVVLGFIVHIVTFLCIYLNIPNAAPLGDTSDKAIITSSPVLAIVCSALLGFGDSCFNTQVYSAIGTMFSEESAPAFAIFKFAQSLAAAVAFIYSTYFKLYVQLGILVVWGVLGTITYVLSERVANRRKIDV